MTIETYARRRAADGRSAGTIIRELESLRAACRWAARSKWNVAPLLFEMPRRKPRSPDRWLTRDEAKRLMAACGAPHVRLFVVLALTTAGRRQALIDLKWSPNGPDDGHVDLAAGLVDLGLGNHYKRRAKMPINDTLRRALAAARDTATTDWVLEIYGRKAGNPRKAIERAYVRAGLTDVARKIHTLRHTAATRMVMAGVNSDRVARALGTTRAMVERVYGHHDPHYLEAAAAALEL